MKTKKILGLVVLASLLGIGATAVPAGAFFTNFDNPVPGTGPLVLPGVTFTPASAGGGAALGTDAPSPPGVYSASVQLLPGTTNTYKMLTITFDRPVFLVKSQLMQQGGGNCSINALDSNGNLLDSQGFNKNDAVYPHFELVVLCAKGIKSVVISVTATASTVGLSCAVSLDNFSFSLAPGAAVIPLF
jgi:hypothetical protein